MREPSDMSVVCHDRNLSTFLSTIRKHYGGPSLLIKTVFPPSPSGLMLAKWIHHMALLFDETGNTLFSLLVSSEERKILKSSGMAVQTTGDIEFLNARCRRCVPKCLFSYRRFGMAHLDWDWLGWGIMEEGSTSSSSHLCEWPSFLPPMLSISPNSKWKRTHLERLF